MEQSIIVLIQVQCHSVGTTAQRPGSASAGMVRFNSETSRFEGYNGSEWINIDIPDDWGSVTETSIMSSMSWTKSLTY